MEKAAEVYTRLKSRVLGPKMESLQKANKAGPEKDKGEAEKGQEKLSGAETRNEKGEEETNAGNIPERAGSVPCPVWARHSPLLGACPVLLGTRDMRGRLLASWGRDQHLQALLCCSARRGKGLGGEGSEGRGQTSSPTPRLWGPPRCFLAQDGSSLPA